MTWGERGQTRDDVPPPRARGVGGLRMSSTRKNQEHQNTKPRPTQPSKTPTTASTTRPSTIREREASVVPLGQTSYINGVAMSDKETVWRGLQHVYGIGRARARQACRHFSRTEGTRISERRRTQVLSALEQWVIEQWMTESKRRRMETDRIKRHRALGSYRGIRMRQGRPVRGQRTSTNAKTAKRLNARRAA